MRERERHRARSVRDETKIFTTHLTPSVLATSAQPSRRGPRAPPSSALTSMDKRAGTARSHPPVPRARRRRRRRRRRRAASRGRRACTHASFHLPLASWRWLTSRARVVRTTTTTTTTASTTGAAAVRHGRHGRGRSRAGPPTARLSVDQGPSSPRVHRQKARFCVLCFLCPSHAYDDHRMHHHAVVRVRVRASCVCACGHVGYHDIEGCTYIVYDDEIHPWRTSHPWRRPAPRVRVGGPTPIHLCPPPSWAFFSSASSVCAWSGVRMMRGVVIGQSPPSSRVIRVDAQIHVDRARRSLRHWVTTIQTVTNLSRYV